jgi:hypothetical protein
MKRQRPRRNGFALAAVLFGLVVMSIFATATLRTSTDEATSVRSFRESGAALFVADAGLRQTIGNWPSAVATMNAGDSLDLGWQTLSNRGRYRAVIHQVDAGGGPPMYLIVVQGRGAGIAAGQRTVVATLAGAVLFGNGGIVANGNVSLTGGSNTDSFNSANGPYNAATADSAGSVVSNGNVTMSNAATIIRGNLTVRGTLSSSLSTVTGTTATGAPLTELDTLACPSGGYTPASDMPSAPGLSYNATTGVLTIGAWHGTPQNFTLTGSSYYFSSVTIGGGSTLTFTGSTHTDIYISNTLDTGGGSIVNTSQNSTNVSIWACGTSSSSQWRLTGGTSAYFAVYAPTHDIVVSGSGNLYGAIVSKAYTASGGSAVHYDKALASMRTPSVNVVPGSWAELTSY